MRRAPSALSRGRTAGDAAPAAAVDPRESGAGRCRKAAQLQRLVAALDAVGWTEPSDAPDELAVTVDPELALWARGQAALPEYETYDEDLDALSALRLIAEDPPLVVHVHVNSPAPQRTRVRVGWLLLIPLWPLVLFGRSMLVVWAPLLTVMSSAESRLPFARATAPTRAAVGARRVPSGWPAKVVCQLSFVAITLVAL